MKNLATKISKIVPTLALVMGMFALNSICITSYHQPEIPSSLNKYRR